MKAAKWSFTTLVLLVIGIAVAAVPVSKTPSIDSIEKIDCHVHFRYTGAELGDLAKEMGFRVVNISTNNFDIEWQAGLARRQRARFPGTIEHLTAFSMQGFSEPWWMPATIERMDRSFDEDGAIGVKIWKDVGMRYQTPGGEFVLIDDKRFIPLLEHLEKRGVTLMLHMADPIEYWQSPEDIESPGRRRIAEGNGLYVMHSKADAPKHQQLIEARDRVLARHPKLNIVGAHLGSLEHDLDALGKCLESHPNFAIDTAARMRDLLKYDREVLRDFLLRHQDQIIYGTDMSIKPHHKGGSKRKQLQTRWEHDWSVLAGHETIETKSVVGELSFRGLALPEEVLKKIYFENAVKWFPKLK